MSMLDLNYKRKHLFVLFGVFANSRMKKRSFDWSAHTERAHRYEVAWLMNSVAKWEELFQAPLVLEVQMDDVSWLTVGALERT